MSTTVGVPGAGSAGVSSVVCPAGWICALLGGAERLDALPGVIDGVRRVRVRDRAPDADAGEAERGDAASDRSAGCDARDQRGWDSGGLCSWCILLTVLAARAAACRPHSPRLSSPLIKRLTPLSGIRGRDALSTRAYTVRGVTIR